MPRSPKAKKSEVKPYDHDSAGDDQSAAGVVADATTKPKPPRGGGPGKKWTPEDRAKVIKAVVKAANVDWKQISEEEFGGTRTASQIHDTWRKSIFPDLIKATGGDGGDTSSR